MPYVLIPQFLSHQYFFHLHHQRSHDLSLSSLLLNYNTMDDDAEDCQGIVEHDVIYTLPRFLKPSLPKLSSMIIQYNNRRKKVCWMRAKIFIADFFIVGKITKRLEDVNGVRKFVILDYLRMLAVVLMVVEAV